MRSNPFRKRLRSNSPRRTILVPHEYEGIDIPIRIYFEARRNVRISIGQENVLLRIPYNISESAIQKHMNWAKLWVNEQMKKSTTLLHRFISKNYCDGDAIKINGEEFLIRLIKEARKSIGIKINEGNLIIKIPKDIPTNELNRAIKLALSRFFGRYYKQQVEKRIDQLNDLYFNEPLQSIRIKYNKSNWGSCSAKRNINISSRLLFAPQEVQDYVFVHELAHLKELNHSPRFWQIVGDIVPDYKQMEKWLKENSHRLDF